MERLNDNVIWCILEEQKQNFLRNSLAPNTVKLYTTGLRHYIRFCREINTNLLPLNEVILENFCVALSSRVRAKSIKNYLCGIQLFASINGDAARIKDMVKVHYVIRGVKRSQGAWHKRPPKAPITFAQLKCILAHISTFVSVHNKYMMSAAVLTAFFGLLRVSEYTTDSPHIYDPLVHLCLNDVSINFHRQLLLVTIKASKTDPFREGLQIRLTATNHHLCPVTAMVRFLAVRGQQQGPLFRFENGRFLTRSHVTAILKVCFPGVVTISTHSFRRGGASALAASGVPQYVIQIMGRWRSDAFLRYVELPDTFFSNTFVNMAHTADHPR